MPTSTRKGLPPELQGQWKTMDQVADWLGVTKQSVRNALKDGVIEQHPNKYFGRVLVNHDSVQRYIDSFKQG